MRPALMIAVAAPVLVHAAHGLGHGHSDAHRRQVAHMEERQLIGGILGGGNSTVSVRSLLQNCTPHDVVRDAWSSSERPVRNRK